MHAGVLRDMEQQRIKRERQLDFDMQRELEAEYKKMQSVRDVTDEMDVPPSTTTASTTASSVPTPSSVSVSTIIDQLPKPSSGNPSIPVGGAVGTGTGEK